MKSPLLACIAALACLTPPIGAQPITAKVVKIAEAPSKSLVTIELRNSHQKGLKSYKAMLVLKDAAGKVVDVQSRWLLGANPQPDKPAIILPNSKTEVHVAITARRPFKQVQIIPSTIILEDGEVITLPPAPPEIEKP